MAIPEARVKAYEHLFTSETGGGPISLFQGLPWYQCGKVFGDFFRGLLGPIYRIAVNVGISALLAMPDALEQVSSIKDTSKSEITQALKAAIHGELSQIDGEQQGSGRKEGRKHKRV